ncbi:hypothetical protein [Umezawaea sp.]|uniref:hypothetical protein n=1 Tax=Umezawaea sp. TaxID=1955258 RepID=UPI002ED2C7D6
MDTTSTTSRRGDRQDLDLLLAFFDEAVEWTVARGRPTQWGIEPWSTDPSGCPAWVT